MGKEKGDENHQSVNKLLIIKIKTIVIVFNLEIAFIHVEFDIGVLDKLKEFDWKAYHVLYAILFGSIAKRGKGRDIDIAVEFEEYNIDLYLKLLNDLREYLSTASL